MTAPSFATLQLDAILVKNLLACGYEKPTDIQARAIPIILAGKDIIASAPTGTGKTAAFVLPILQHSFQVQQTKPSVLILTPTRELAAQITEAIRQYGKNLKLNTISIVGGTSYTKQFRDLAKRVDIIVATPGRLKDHMQRNKVDLSGIQVLVLDEADRMLDMGFIEPVKEIARLTPKTRQTLLFSATVEPQIIKLAGGILNNPERISIASQKTAHTQIEQKLYTVKNPAQKSKLLRHLLQETSMFKAIIFSATKVGADRLMQELRHSGYDAAALHGDMRQSQRNRTVEDLRSGKIQLLVATDVGSRGLDINDLTHVINYHLPRTAEDYVHRIGRTGRAGKTGIAISFALPEDMRLLKRIEQYVGKPITRVSISTALFADQAKDTAVEHVSSRVKPKREERQYSLDDYKKDRQHTSSRFAAEDSRPNKRKSAAPRDRDRGRETFPKKDGQSRFKDKNPRQSQSRFQEKEGNRSSAQKPFRQSDERRRASAGRDTVQRRDRDSDRVAPSRRQYDDRKPMRSSTSRDSFRQDKDPSARAKSYHREEPRSSRDRFKHKDSETRRPGGYRDRDVKASSTGDKSKRFARPAKSNKRPAKSFTARGQSKPFKEKEKE